MLKYRKIIQKAVLSEKVHQAYRTENELFEVTGGYETEETRQTQEAVGLSPQRRKITIYTT